MDTLPLPPRPRLDQYRKRAKELVAAARSGNAESVREWAKEWLHALVERLDLQITPFVQGSIDRAVDRLLERVRRTPAESFGLSDAQHLIAAAHGFESWAAFVRHVEDASGRAPRDPFEQAADAVVGGDIAGLTKLLDGAPELTRARSPRVHRATLLHYVAANGVEDFRQKTPRNAVEIARLMLERGAEVDALAETYGGGPLQTTMNLLVSSTHPAGAGLQPALVDVLLDFGAAINGVRDDESPLLTALSFGYDDAAETLARRGARVDTVLTAAALGRLDLVQRFVADKATLRPGVRLLSTPWRAMPDDPKLHIELALVWACKFGRDEVANHLLDIGVDPRSADSDHMTALHWAAANGRAALVRRLLSMGAELEAMNAWQGTVLSSTAHFAIHQSRGDVDYPAMMALLLAAGANVNAAYPTGDKSIDDLLREHGAG